MELLKKLTQINAPSGSEDGIRAFLEEQMKPYADEIYTDALGNLICRKRGGGKVKAAVAHMDEIGVMATYIDDNGFIRFAPIGGLNVKNLMHLKVRFANGTIGVIGAEEEAFYEKATTSKLYIDIGAKDADEAAEKVKIGDTAVFIGDFYECGENIVSKALDNRVGCWALIEAAKNNMCINDMYYIFTVQEEVGLRGAKAAVYAADIDSAVVLDVTDTGDTPEAPKMAVKLGGGAAIKVMDRSVICHHDVREELRELARINGIPYQMEIMTDGGTDAGAIHSARTGVKTGGISIPARYIHSPSEMISKSDLDACCKLLTLWQNN